MRRSALSVHRHAASFAIQRASLPFVSHVRRSFSAPVKSESVPHWRISEPPIARYPWKANAGEASSVVPRVLRLVDYIGTSVFALSGSIAAATAGMDCYGATVVGCITALGGGSIRDAILLARRPFWLTGEGEYAAIAFLTAVLGFFYWRDVPRGNLVRKADGSEGVLLDVLDSGSLGAFAVIGAASGIRAGLHPLFAFVCGTLTATGGGMIRDVLIGEPRQSGGSRARVLHSYKEIYATCAAAGSAVYVGLAAVGMPLGLRIVLGAGTTALSRWLAVRDDIRLPTWIPVRGNITAQMPTIHEIVDSKPALPTAVSGGSVSAKK